MKVDLRTVEQVSFFRVPDISVHNVAEYVDRRLNEPDRRIYLPSLATSDKFSRGEMKKWCDKNKLEYYINEKERVVIFSSKEFEFETGYSKLYEEIIKTF